MNKIPTIEERHRVWYKIKLAISKIIVAVCNKQQKIYQHAIDIVEQDDMIDLGFSSNQYLFTGSHGLRGTAPIDPYEEMDTWEDAYEMMLIQEDFEKEFRKKLDEIFLMKRLEKQAKS